MRLSSRRPCLAWLLVCLVTLMGTAPARADVILSSDEADRAAAVASVEGSRAPACEQPAEEEIAPDDTRVGYLTTWDEFLGGLVMIGVAVGIVVGAAKVGGVF